MKLFLLVTNSKGAFTLNALQVTSTRAHLTFYGACKKTIFETSDVLFWKECGSEDEVLELVASFGLALTLQRGSGSPPPSRGT